MNELRIEELSQKFPAISEYLCQIFFINRDYGAVSNAKLASRLEISRPAVTQAVNRLKTLNLVTQPPYGDIEFTDEGRDLAKEAVRRHYILEHLLVKVLDYPWDKSDDEAARIQGIVSADLIEHIYSKLGKPQTCPHGNPFPDGNVEEKLTNAPNLSDFESEAPVLIRILRVTEEGEHIEGLLKACNELNIQPGRRFTLIAVSEKSVQLKTEAGAQIELPRAFADHIRYEVLSDKEK